LEDIRGLLHLARKAGKLVLGQTAVLEKAKSSTDLLILITSDAGQVLLRKFRDIEFVDIRMTSDELGEVFNRDRLSVLAVSDKNFGDEIKKRLSARAGKPESRPLSD